ncbi:uncharacterized protein LOC143263911 [Megachile rotundata]|uniref:uncharacterized protein LOC143263911 n=1 Tax=Megachile rotundata TaxID=143995 RepID=UPI000614B544|nr:PREDICTED: uncharacterized protein LOC100883261 [Megachile rotundata]
MKRQEAPKDQTGQDIGLQIVVASFINTVEELTAEVRSIRSEKAPMAPPQKSGPQSEQTLEPVQRPVSKPTSRAASRQRKESARPTPGAGPSKPAQPAVKLTPKSMEETWSIVVGRKTMRDAKKAEQANAKAGADRQPAQATLVLPQVHTCGAALLREYRGVEFVRSERVNSDRYRQQTINLHHALIEKRPEWARKHGKVTLQHDNAPSHEAKPVKEAMKALKWNILSHPPYSPNLAPSNYQLFASMGHALAEEHFANFEEVREWFNEWFCSKDKQFFWDGIHKLPER